MVGLIFTIIMGGIASIMFILNEHKKEIWDAIKSTKE